MRPWIHIIGGGLSGLSLAESLSKYPKFPGPVVISEPKITNLNERTFSFWFTKPEESFLRPQHVSDRWSISGDGFQVKHRGQRFSYGTIMGKTVLSAALKAVEAHPQITIREERVSSMPDADHVFDCRPQGPDTFSLIQSFAGTEIVFHLPHGVESVGLMHSLEATSTGIRFLYLLPLSQRRLLIEHTEFTSVPADLDKLSEMNQVFIAQEFPLGAYEVTRVEAAHIPMGFKKRESAFGIPLGSRAGMARNATGYGYRTIRYTTHRMAQELIEKNQITPYRSPRLVSWADSLFIELIKNRPEAMPAVLAQLARNMGPDNFAAFMTSYSLTDILRVLWTAPMKPFLLAWFGLYRWI